MLSAIAGNFGTVAAASTGQKESTSLTPRLSKTRTLDIGFRLSFRCEKFRLLGADSVRPMTLPALGVREPGLARGVSIHRCVNLFG